MKTIGLLGGMSWESSLEYYRVINEEVKRRVGGLHSADCLMYSFDFAEIEARQMSGAWDELTQMMIAGAQRLERGGAECLMICTNTMHKMADDVQKAITIPIIHIADPTAQAIKAQNLSTIGLLGTKFTMQEDFYKGRLIDKHGLNVLVPDADGIAYVNQVIYDELVLGTINDESRKGYVEIINQLAEQGAECVILGCTEIGLLIKQSDTDLPVFDTTTLHALAAVDFALEGIYEHKLD
jgi:aspartate racemase